MKILIIGGFLGSGKTSFLLRLIRHMTEDLHFPKPVILENEIGAVPVDDKVLGGSGYQVRGLFGGCICCTLAGDLPETVREIERDLQPEWLLIEATGTAFPGSVRDRIRQTLGYDSRIICLADAQRWKRLSSAMGDMMRWQLEDADLILVNKADLVTPEELEETAAAVRALNPAATVCPAAVTQEIPEDLIDPLLAGISREE